MATDSAMVTANSNASHSVPQRTYQVVMIATKSMGISKDGKLAWTLPSDLKFYTDITTKTYDPAKKNAVIMGRTSWENMALMNEEQPMPGRLNIVLTSSGKLDTPIVENVVVCESMISALQLLASSPYSQSIETVFVIGGGKTLREYLNGSGCDAIHLTEIETDIECDTFMPAIDHSVFHPWYSSFPLVENNIRFCFNTYVRVRNSTSEVFGQTSGLIAHNSVRFDVKKFPFLPKMVFEKHEEYGYLRLVEDILSNGAYKDERTKSDTLSIFGCQMRFNLRKSFPLLTTQKINWRGVVEQLLLLISGQGVDQLSDIIDKVKNYPNERRIILSAWNPCDLEKIGLPPCHIFSQFYVANGELSCQMYQHTADMGVGSVPFIIASYSLLTCLITHVCDLVPGDFIHIIGDAHINPTHIRPLQEQLKKQPTPFPILRMNALRMDIDAFVVDDFELIGYDLHQKIDEMEIY